MTIRVACVTIQDMSEETMTTPQSTKRTRLRPFTEKDRALVRTLCADPAVMRFFPAPLDEEASDALLAKILAHQKHHGFSF